MLEIALDYSAQGLAVIPILPRTKEPAVRWRAWQSVLPTPSELEVMFAGKPDCGVAVICGTASGNLAVVDCETQDSFDRFRRRFDDAQIDTWAVRTARGGHLYLRTPVAVRPVKAHDFEIRSQGQYVVAPPSIHPSGTRYEFQTRPAEIAGLDSLERFEWLPLKPAATSTPMPRRALALLQGRADSHYPSRSEYEQIIVVSLVNVGFTFGQILGLFRKHPCAGKFHELDRENPENAERWLRLGFERALELCQHDSPERVQACQIINWALSRAWPGRTGGTDRAVFGAHASIAYRAGSLDYTASCRQLAEIVGCDKLTASRSTARLKNQGLIQTCQRTAYDSSGRYRISTPQESELHEYTTTRRVGEVLYAQDSLLVPEAFRQAGLGRSAYEVWFALREKPMSPNELASKTGRHIQTVRTALKRMSEIIDLTTGKALELVTKRGKRWHIATEVDLEAVARAVGTHGAREKQKVKHRIERIKHRQRDLASYRDGTK
jgi:predicted transcriptional regulator